MWYSKVQRKLVQYGDMHFNVFSFFAANHVAITSTNSYYFHVFWMNNRTLEEIAIYLITTNDQELWISRMKCAWLEFFAT